MAKPRRVSALSSVLKETQEDEQVTPTTVEQETANTEKQISVDTDKHLAVNTEIQKSATTEVQKPVTTIMQNAVSTDTAEKTHKQTITISEDLAFRLKVHAARRKETIASIATRAFEKLLAEEDI